MFLGSAGSFLLGKCSGWLILGGVPGWMMHVRDQCCIPRIDGLPVFQMVNGEMTGLGKEEPD